MKIDAFPSTHNHVQLILGVQLISTEGKDN